MTPISLWLAQRLPASMVPFALTAIYASMVLGLMLFAGLAAIDIAYVDVGR